jgi:predicted ester cyclase
VRFLVGEGDLVAARLNFRGTQTGASGPYPPSGRLLDADFLAVFRVEAGRITETWVEFDNLNALVQLGHYSWPG